MNRMAAAGWFVCAGISLGAARAEDGLAVPSNPPVVRDAAGKIVGSLIGEASVYMTLNGNNVALPLGLIPNATSARYWFAPSELVYFSQPSCLGSVLLPARRYYGPGRPGGVVLDGARELLYVADSREGQYLPYQSFMYEDGACRQSSGQDWVLVARPSPIVLTDKFTLPLTPR